MTAKNVLLEKGCSQSKHYYVARKHHDAGVFLVERYTASRKLEWDTFVKAAKNSTFLFSRDYMDYHSERFTDHSLMIFKDHALLASLERRQTRSPVAPTASNPNTEGSGTGVARNPWGLPLGALPLL
jgi:hypothetical protein